MEPVVWEKNSFGVRECGEGFLALQEESIFLFMHKEFSVSNDLHFLILHCTFNPPISCEGEESIFVTLCVGGRNQISCWGEEFIFLSGNQIFYMGIIVLTLVGEELNFLWERGGPKSQEEEESNFGEAMPTFLERYSNGWGWVLEERVRAAHKTTSKTKVRTENL